MTAESKATKFLRELKAPKTQRRKKAFTKKRDSTFSKRVARKVSVQKKTGLRTREINSYWAGRGFVPVLDRIF